MRRLSLRVFSTVCVSVCVCVSIGGRIVVVLPVRSLFVLLPVYCESILCMKIGEGVHNPTCDHIRDFHACRILGSMDVTYMFYLNVCLRIWVANKFKLCKFVLLLPERWIIPLLNAIGMGPCSAKYHVNVGKLAAALWLSLSLTLCWMNPNITLIVLLCFVYHILCNMYGTIFCTHISKLPSDIFVDIDGATECGAVVVR